MSSTQSPFNSFLPKIGEKPLRLWKGDVMVCPKGLVLC